MKTAESLKSHLSRTLLGILSLSMACVTELAASAQGLLFNDSNYSVSKRTSFDVFGQDLRKFRNELSIDFELASYPGSQLGYLFRIQNTPESDLVWNLSYNIDRSNVCFRLNEEGVRSVITAEIPRKEISSFEWLDFSLRFDSAKDSVYLQIGRYRYQAPVQHLPATFRPVIIFGRSGVDTEVPSFAIRHLEVRDARRSYVFPLDEREGDVSHDARGKVFGRVENPRWLLTEESQWRMMYNVKSARIYDVLYLPLLKQFVSLDQEALSTYQLSKHSKSSIAYQNACPVNLADGKCYLSGDGKTICWYAAEKGGGSHAGGMACLDLETMAWTSYPDTGGYLPKEDHTGFNLPGSGNYLVFGGRDDMHYYHSFHELGPERKWKQVWETPIEGLDNRFSCCAGTADGAVYLFGGKGNRCGDRMVGTSCYYDLFRIDSETGKGERLWEQKEEDLYTPSSRMMIRDGRIYLLARHDDLEDPYVSLVSYQIKDGERTEWGSRIAMPKNENTVGIGFWFDEELEILYLTALEELAGESTNLKIYTMRFQQGTAVSQNDAHSPLFWLILAILAAMTAVYLVFRKKKTPSAGKEDPDVATEEEPGLAAASRPTKNAIYLFGDFTILDKDGNDITDTCSNQQKEMMCVLLDHDDVGGVSSKKLGAILWPDKDTEKVKNSKGVAINKLRTKLTALEGVCLLFENGLYRLDHDGRFYCDFLEFKQLMSQERTDRQAVDRITSRGAFLSSNEDSLLNSFQERIDSTVRSMRENK